MYNDDIKNINEKETPIYIDFEKANFVNNGTFFEAQNVLFNKLMVSTFNIFAENLDEGLKIVEEINNRYKNVDLRKLCSDLIVLDGYAEEWDEEITTSDIAYKYLSNYVMEIDVVCKNKELSIWFENKDNEGLYGGHNPRLYLYSDKDYKFVGIE